MSMSISIFTISNKNNYSSLEIGWGTNRSLFWRKSTKTTSHSGWIQSPNHCKYHLATHSYHYSPLCSLPSSSWPHSLSQSVVPVIGVWGEYKLLESGERRVDDDGNGNNLACAVWYTGHWRFVEKGFEDDGGMWRNGGEMWDVGLWSVEIGGGLGKNDKWGMHIIDRCQLVLLVWLLF